MTPNVTSAFRTPARAVLAAALVAFLIPGLVVPAQAKAAGCAGAPEAGYRMLLDGSAESMAGWSQSGPGGFTVQADCSIKSSGGLGLLWFGEEFSSYTLKLDWKIDKLVDNAGIFVGFPSEGTNTHNSAIGKGYEIQIDQLGRSTGEAKYITGAIYSIQGPNRDTRLEVTKPTDWNTYEITVDNPKITVRLNGVVVNEFTSTSPARDLTTGHIGLQNHGLPDTVSFRNVQIKEIAPGSGGGETPSTVTGDLSALRNNTGIAHDPTSNANFDGVGYSYSAPVLRAVGAAPGAKVTADGLTYTLPSTPSGASDNVVARGQTIPLSGTVGATKLGFLAAADHGPSTGKFTLNYEFTDATGVVQRKAVDVNMTFSDWTLNGGGGSPSPRNTTAVTVPTRVLASAAPDGTKAYLFSVTALLDRTMTLKSVKLPLAYAGQIHLFDVAVDGAGTTPPPPPAPATTTGAVLAVPGSSTAGFANPVVTIRKGEGATLLNYDELQQHDVTGPEGPDRKPLFASDYALPRESKPILGVENLAPGQYAFTCSLHGTNMSGTLIVN